MATTIYGIDWYNGDGLTYAYTNLADAQLDVFDYLIVNHIDNVSSMKYEIGALEEQSEELANNSTCLMEDEYIDDMMNIVYLNLSDKFTPYP